MLPPLGVGAGGGFVLDQRSAPGRAAGRAWPGVSGAAVFCRGLLTAVVTRDDREFGNRRLHAIPASALTAEPEFGRLITEDTGTAPVLEAVELVEYLQASASPLLARTPGSLLAAAVEAVEFTGRRSELAELVAWQDSGESFSVMLITGEGGQGKTRLARQFAAQTRQAGWVAGFLAARISGPVPGDSRNQLQATMELAGRVREATRPVLLITDYAETRPDEITALADALRDSTRAYPARILLLSRTAGAWWDNLTEALDLHIVHRISLEPLTEAGMARHDAYAAAVTGLARHLATLPDSPIERDPGQPWSVLAGELAAQPPRLDDPRLGNALNLQITALTSLLAAAAGQAHVGAFGERELVGHERGYLRRAAAKRRLFSSGILSDLADDDERAVWAWAALERALAAIILLGPCSTSQARAIGALTSEARADDVVNWLAALYPAPDEGFGLGTVQPDRLAELLLGPILTQQTGLLGQICDLATGLADAYAILFALTRTTAHPGFSQVGEQARDLITDRPEPFAIAAPLLAITMPQATPLRDGLLLLGQQDPEAFRQSVYAVADRLPEDSVVLASFSAALIQTVTGIVHRLAEIGPEVYEADLARLLTALSARLASAGRRQEAAVVARKAVSVCRQMAAASEHHLPDLATALNNLSNNMRDAGQRQAAIAPAQEAVQIFQQLAVADSETHLADLALALNNLSNTLSQAGQRTAAVAPAQEAVTAYRQLSALEPMRHRRDLAMSLNNLTHVLAEIGQREAALSAALEATSIMEQLAAADPDAHLPRYAHTLTNLAIRLAEAGENEAALASTQKAVIVQRRLTGVNPQAHLPGLARALQTLANRLADVGQQEAALSTSLEAAEILQLLARSDPDAFLPMLAAISHNLAEYLAQARQSEAALARSQAAVTIFKKLVERDPEAHLPGLIGSLAKLSMIEAESRRPEAARGPALEACEIFRQLASAEPDAQFADLARRLGELALCLEEAGLGDVTARLAEVVVNAYKRLAGVNSGAYLAELASSLDLLVVCLGASGQSEAALPYAQDAISVRRKLAETDPGANLPSLVTTLTTLTMVLTDIGQFDRALTTISEAVKISGRIAETESDMTGLRSPLSHLAGALSSAGRESDVEQMWEFAIATLADRPSRWTLNVAHARHLLQLEETAEAGVNILVDVVTTVGVPPLVQAEAQHVLRLEWQQRPQAIERAWQSAGVFRLPDWIYLSDEYIDLVIGWININSAVEARNYLEEHRELLSPAAGTVLDELALRAPADLIDQYRLLLTDARKNGIANAYWTLVLAELLREWMAAPDWDSSHDFLRDHPELLEDDARELLSQLDDESDPAVDVHLALLTITIATASIEDAYQCLSDQQSLQTMVSGATGAQVPSLIHACATIETFVQGRPFIGALHTVLAQLMTDPAMQLPEEFASRLRALAAQADSAERAQAAAELDGALTVIPADGVAVGQLRQILALPERT